MLFIFVKNFFLEFVLGRHKCEPNISLSTCFWPCFWPPFIAVAHISMKSVKRRFIFVFFFNYKRMDLSNLEFDHKVSNI
jgi:hypothetical protein